MRCATCDGTKRMTRTGGPSLCARWPREGPALAYFSRATARLFRAFATKRTRGRTQRTGARCRLEDDEDEEEIFRIEGEDQAWVRRP